MRLFHGIFATLALQALLVSVVPGGALVLFLHQHSTDQFQARDIDRLQGLAFYAEQLVRDGKPLANAIGYADQNRLAGRVSLISPDGAAIAGPNLPAIAEHPVTVGGQTIAVARLIRTAPLDEAERRYLAGQFMGAGLVTLVLLTTLLIAGYVFARRWSIPQLELYRMSREVVHGDHEITVSEHGPPETVATMRNLQRVAGHFNRLETARRTFLLSISDELKRPTEALGENYIALCEHQPSVHPDLLSAIEENTYQLIHIAEDLSAIALADLGRLPVSFADVDPRALIHNAIWGYKKRAASLGVSLETSTLPGYTILVKWDAARIEQLFGALIDNSLRYTPAGGRIVLGLESSRDAWRLIIDDSAPGVDIMLSQSLFDPFFRSPDRNESSDTASGLGLASARSIVEAHHGRIEASQSPIGGLRVTVILPAKPPTA